MGASHFAAVALFLVGFSLSLPSGARVALCADGLGQGKAPANEALPTDESQKGDLDPVLVDVFQLSKGASTGGFHGLFGGQRRWLRRSMMRTAGRVRSGLTRRDSMPRPNISSHKELPLRRTTELDLIDVHLAAKYASTGGFFQTGAARSLLAEPQAGPKLLDKQWMSIQDSFRKLAAATKSVDALWIGDSICEGWNETMKGYPMPRLTGARKEFDRLFSSARSGTTALNFCIGQDVVSNIKWRLQNGDLFDEGGSVTVLKVKVLIINIGINDILHGQSTTNTADEIISLVKWVNTKQPKLKVLVTGILPESFSMSAPKAFSTAPQAQPGQVNRILSSLRKTNGGRNRFVDCTSSFIDPSTGSLDESLYISMPFPLLHLSVKGHARWADCLRPTLQSFLSKKKKNGRRQKPQKP